MGESLLGCLLGRGGVDKAAGLPAPQRSVVTVAAEQLGVRAFLDDAAAIEHDQRLG